jgi:hypothetical protein
MIYNDIYVYIVIYIVSIYIYAPYCHLTSLLVTMI